jgi:uncharacterized SAM-binding protein YcdF (DUF218 family)
MNKKVWGIILVSGLLLTAACLNPPWPQLVKILTIDQQPENADVIIVLAGETERELYAAELYMQGFAPRIIMSGCAPAGQLMAQRAVERGVPGKDIIVEEKSVSTYENAIFSKDIVLQQNLKSAMIVTSNYHMLRSKMVFERVFKGTGVKLVFCAAKGTSLYNGHLVNYYHRVIIKEYIKLPYYWLRYW